MAKNIRKIWKATTQTNNQQTAKKINELVNEDHDHYWDAKFSNITKGSQKLWNLTKKFKGNFNSHASQIKLNDQSTIGDADRANCLAKIFEKAHTITENYTHENDRVVHRTIAGFNTFRHLKCSTPVISIDDIHAIIQSLSPFKSAGPDTIQNMLLKNLPPSALNWLAHIFNKCLEFSYWPTNFKQAKVIPILKAGKSPSDPKQVNHHLIRIVIARSVYSTLLGKYSNVLYTND